jgi:hypothetical protein
MNGNNGYAVFFFPQALEALGEAIKPYLQDGPGGPHVVCNGIDTGGALVEMTLAGTTNDGRAVEVELMVPSGMVRMIVSAHSDEMFGFGPHALRGAVKDVPPVAEAADTAAGAAEAAPAPGVDVAAKAGGSNAGNADAAKANPAPAAEGKS